MGGWKEHRGRYKVIRWLWYPSDWWPVLSRVLVQRLQFPVATDAAVSESKGTRSTIHHETSRCPISDLQSHQMGRAQRLRGFGLKPFVIRESSIFNYFFFLLFVWCSLSLVGYRVWVSPSFHHGEGSQVQNFNFCKVFWSNMMFPASPTPSTQTASLIQFPSTMEMN